MALRDSELCLDSETLILVKTDTNWTFPRWFIYDIIYIGSLQEMLLRGLKLPMLMFYRKGGIAWNTIPRLPVRLAAM